MNRSSAMLQITHLQNSCLHLSSCGSSLFFYVFLGVCQPHYITRVCFLDFSNKVSSQMNCVNHAIRHVYAFLSLLSSKDSSQMKSIDNIILHVHVLEFSIKV